MLLVLMLALIVGSPLAGVMSRGLQALTVEVERFCPLDPLFLDEKRVLASMVVAASVAVGFYCWLFPGRSYVERAAGVQALTAEVKHACLPNPLSFG